MTYAEIVLPEFDQEMANTRKVLECVPDDKFDWKAHPKANTIGWVANHLAEINSWVAGTLTGTEWDFNPVGGEKYQSPALKSKKEILALFDQNTAAARAALQAVNDADIDVKWTLLDGGKPFITMPRRDVIRYWVLNHTIHHRAYLLSYLRMLDIAVPGMYGPA